MNIAAYQVALVKTFAGYHGAGNWIVTLLCWKAAASRATPPAEIERKTMKIIGSKFYYCLIPCRGILTTAIVLTWFISSHLAQAAAGDLDPTFGTGGKLTTDLGHSADSANAVAVQADGKLVVVGQTFKNNDSSQKDFAVARYNTDGTLDTTF